MGCIEVVNKKLLDTTKPKQASQWDTTEMDGLGTIDLATDVHRICSMHEYTVNIYGFEWLGILPRIWTVVHETFPCWCDSLRGVEVANLGDRPTTCYCMHGQYML